jgi:alpha-tubulin suppressor-like RCC1 family protein
MEEITHECKEIVNICCNENTAFFIDDNKKIYYHNDASGISEITKIKHDFGIIDRIMPNGDGVVIINKKNHIFKIDEKISIQKINHNIENIKNIYCGNNCIFIVDDDNNIYCCGDKLDEKIGLTVACEKTDEFIKIDGQFGNIENIICGSRHTLIINSENKIYPCGYNLYNQCNIDSLLENKKNISQIVCSRFSTYVLYENNKLFSMGCNTYGNLGLGHKKEAKKFTEIIFDFGTIEKIFANMTGDILFVLNKIGEIYMCGCDIFNIVNAKHKKKCTTTFEKIFTFTKNKKNNDIDIDDELIYNFDNIIMDTNDICI